MTVVTEPITKAEALLRELHEQATDPITSEHYPDAAAGYDNARIIVKSALPDIQREERRAVVAEIRARMADVDRVNAARSVEVILKEIEAR